MVRAGARLLRRDSVWIDQTDAPPPLHINPVAMKFERANAVAKSLDQRIDGLGAHALGGDLGPHMFDHLLTGHDVAQVVCKQLKQ